MTDNPITDSLLNQQLDEYRLEAVLGQGGMARVYRGLDVRLNRLAAIKVINPSFRASQDYKDRFEREAQAIARLKHPHIVGVYRYGEANGLLYLAMEYIEGTDLAAALDAYRPQQALMPSAEVSRIIRQLGLALDYAHSQGVIHRDVKPSNIMLDQQGQVILTDFGLALLTEVGTQGGFLGTPYYMAPEQAYSSAGAVPQSDLYAVGVILYEIFTGELPFDGPSALEIARLHLDEPPPLPRDLNPDLHPALEVVILRALAKEPEDRYPSGAALADALEQALQKSATASPPVGASELPPMPAVVFDSMLSQSHSREISSGAPPPGQLVERGEMMTKIYYMKNIRALLTEGFSAEELRRFCHDEPDFKPVYHQLAESTGKAEIIDRLLEFAEQTLQLDKLLELVEALNSARYNKHRPYYDFAPRREPLRPGRSLGKYNIVEWLGQGGIAEVYKSFQSSLSRYVAIKVLHGHLADNEDVIERFEREAMAVAKLRHPNIVQVFDFEREDELYYMVMEFINGRTLEAELKERQRSERLFPLSEAITIVKELASAIHYAHEQGIIHRDLKPGNIMIDIDRQRMVLTDFGIAQIMNVPGHTATNMIIGTLAYMAPEQAEDSRQADRRSDIYSLGVILYELVTGRLPFAGGSPLAIMVQHLNEPPPSPTQFNSDLPLSVEQVILKALNKKPADRYQTADELAQALQTAIEPPPIWKQPDPPRQEVPIDLPTELMKELRLGHVVLFCGEGISMGEGGLPSSHQLAQDLAKEADLGDVIGKALLDVAEDFEVDKGRNGLITKITQLTKQDSYYSPLPTHHLIASLPFKRIVTTNWDELLYKALEQTHQPLDRIITDGDWFFTSDDHIWLIKLHGSFERRESLILTRKDYSNIFNGRPTTHERMRSFFAQNTLLFLGVDLSDRDFRQMYDEMTRNLDQLKRRNYAVQPNPDKRTGRYWQQENVELINADVTEFLQALQTKLAE